MAQPDPEDVLAKSRGAGPALLEEEGARLPPDTTIELDCRDTRGRRYTGRFNFSVPTLGQQIDIGKMKTAYLPQGSPADPNAATIIDVVCYLTVCVAFNELSPKPAWWAPFEARDITPYGTLYGRCLEYEARFHGRDTKHRSAEDGLPAASDSSAVSRGSEIRVGDEVRPASKRRETLAGDGS